MVVGVVGGEDGLAGDILEVAEPRALSEVPASDGILADDVIKRTAVLAHHLPILLLSNIHQYNVSAREDSEGARLIMR
jgi:hypothetical protein